MCVQLIQDTGLLKCDLYRYRLSHLCIVLASDKGGQDQHGGKGEGEQRQILGF